MVVAQQMEALRVLGWRPVEKGLLLESSNEAAATTERCNAGWWLSGVVTGDSWLVVKSCGIFNSSAYRHSLLPRGIF